MAWQRSMLLVEDIYKRCAALPADERFGLSASANERPFPFRPISARGPAESDRPSFDHLEVALGSQAEVEVQVELARRLGLIDEKMHTQAPGQHLRNHQPPSTVRTNGG